MKLVTLLLFKLPLLRLLAVALAGAMLPPGFAAEPPREISRSGMNFLLDGAPFEMWGMRVASASQTQALTVHLIAQFDSYKAAGLNTLSVCYQGSSGAYTNPFSDDGLSIEAGHKARMEQIVKAARAQGMVVIVNVFYGRTIWKFDGAAAVNNVLKTVAKDLLPYRNVIISPGGETNTSRWNDKRAIFDMGVPANIGALCASVHSVDPKRLCGAGGTFEADYNIALGRDRNVDVLLFDTGAVMPDSSFLYNLYVAHGVRKPIVNVEMFGALTLQWLPAGVFSDAVKNHYYAEIDRKRMIPGLSLFFFSEPWHQRDPIHYELGGDGTPDSPGIRWFWDYVRKGSRAP
jgi:hypothetical protein